MYHPKSDPLDGHLRHRLLITPGLKRVRAGGTASGRVWQAEVFDPKTGTVKQRRLYDAYREVLRVYEGDDPTEARKDREKALESARHANKEAIERFDRGQVEQSQPLWVVEANQDLDWVWEEFVSHKVSSGSWSRGSSTTNGTNQRPMWDRFKAAFPEVTTLGQLIQFPDLELKWGRYLDQEARTRWGGRLQANSKNGHASLVRNVLNTLKARKLLPPEYEFGERRRWNAEQDRRAGSGRVVLEHEDLAPLLAFIRSTPIPNRKPSPITGAIASGVTDPAKLHLAALQIEILAYLGPRREAEAAYLTWDRVRWETNEEGDVIGATLHLDPVKMKRTKNRHKQGWADLPLPLVVARPLYELRSLSPSVGKTRIFKPGLKTTGDRLGWWSECFYHERGEEKRLTIHQGLRPHAIEYAEVVLGWPDRYISGFFHNSAEVRRQYYNSDAFRPSDSMIQPFTTPLNRGEDDGGSDEGEDQQQFEML